MKNVFTKEAKIGLVSIVSLALLYLGINYLKGINLFKPTNHYVVACTNVKGVTVSSPVFVEGFKVGLVRANLKDGWRLPTDEDWQKLEMAFGMSEHEVKKTGWRGKGVVELLHQGDDGSCFNLQMAGCWLVGDSGHRTGSH